LVDAVLNSKFILIYFALPNYTFQADSFDIVLKYITKKYIIKVLPMKNVLEI